MSKTYTVSQLARLAGVSVCTLRHYDEIGLLELAFTGENRYRYNGEAELLRLQQILIHRELDIPLLPVREDVRNDRALKGCRWENAALRSAFASHKCNCA